MTSIKQRVHPKRVFGWTYFFLYLGLTFFGIECIISFVKVDFSKEVRF